MPDRGVILNVIILFHNVLPGPKVPRSQGPHVPVYWSDHSSTGDRDLDLDAGLERLVSSDIS